MSDTIAEELFTLRPDAIEDEGLRALYDEVAVRLREEASSRVGFGMLEQLMVERVAFLYVWIRDREARGVGSEGVNPTDPTKRPGFVHERNYRETMDMWFDWATKLQRAEAKGLDEDEATKDRVLSRAGQIMAQVADDRLAPAEAQSFKAALADEFEKVDL